MILIQNYSDLTLIDMNVGRAGDPYGYTVSNNFGSMTVKGDTNITSTGTDEDVAFDVWYGMNGQGLYDAGITITFDDDFTGTVSGNVEYGAANRAKNNAGWEDNATVTISNGTFNTTLVASNGNDLADANITVSGGTFSEAVRPEYCVDGFEPKDNGNDTYCVQEIEPAVNIIANDAYIGEDGKGYLRYITELKYGPSKAVESFGTWFIPADLLDTENYALVEYGNTAITSGQSYNSDLLGIPQNSLDRSIVGISFVKQIGKNIVVIKDFNDGSETRTEIDTAPQIIDGRTLVPIRAVSEALSADVQWNNDERTVIISSGGLGD